jgi:hypothetical protein
MRTSGNCICGAYSQKTTIGFYLWEKVERPPDEGVPFMRCFVCGNPKPSNDVIYENRRETMDYDYTCPTCGWAYQLLERNKVRERKQELHWKRETADRLIRYTETFDIDKFILQSKIGTYVVTIQHMM